MSGGAADFIARKPSKHTHLIMLMTSTNPARREVEIALR